MDRPKRRSDTLFRTGRAREDQIDDAAVAAAVARGHLRAAHLREHLAKRDALTAEQRAEYGRLRGYTP